jgi:hypothetical protein
MGTAALSELRELVTDLARSTKELRQSQKETDRQFKATDRKIKELGTLFTGQWGKLVESLLASGLVEVFQKWGLGVSAVSRDYEILDATGRKPAQIDVLLHNGGEDVAVEIKTTCRPKEIDEHIDRLARLRSGRREYSEGGKKLYAAVAALKYEAEADIYAEKKGFFVLKSSDGIVEIGNREGFRPRAY